MKIHLARRRDSSRSLCWPIRRAGGLLISNEAAVTCRACVHGMNTGRRERGGFVRGAWNRGRWRVAG